MTRRIILALEMTALMFASASVAAEILVGISSGYETSSGDYGQANTTRITTIPLTVQLWKDAWRFSLSIPYIEVKGDGSVIPGSVSVISGNVNGNSQMAPGSGSSSTQTTTVWVEEIQSGAGDVATSASYAFLPWPGEFMFYELSAEIKWGTASAANNLGTGENDYSVKLYSMYDKFNLKPFVSLGYLVIGDTATVDYNDVLFASAGAVYQMDYKTSLRMVYDYEQAATDTADEGVMAGLYGARQLNREWSASIYFLKGLSDSVAESGAGFLLSVNF